MRLSRRQWAREAARAWVQGVIEVLQEEAEQRRDSVRSDGPGDEAVADYGHEVEGPHFADSPEQYAAATNALTLVGYMWAALVTDDDQTIIDVLLPETLAALGNYELRPAARLREAIGMTRETCGVMGCALTVRVLADGSFLVLCFQMTPGFGGIQEYGDGLTTVPGLAVLISQVEGRWWLVGHHDRGPGQRVVGLVDVIPPSESPTN